MKTLTQQAKAVSTIRKRRHNAKFDEKQIEDLAIAYFEGAITYTQASTVTGMTGSGLYTAFVPAIKRLFQAGKLKKV